ncbi:hypothetical protein GCM10010377_76520 [Streptomyces viridiviolaceus]|uniref:Uncharacterized protein n=1 Tax=Streptomyces viridiviolaceus TaxID=68282 RepID=A0ABW2EB09_9ACTN|nr:hypothetical protein [Streptomyces viridiviolaceus]GHB74777.1 hypothetical protein GCM10010377_76520 [Streptomyces viridiviolaceus]
MLTSVPIGWLWLLAVASTVLSSCTLGSWIPLRKFRIAYPMIMVVGGSVLVVVCRLQGIDLSGALVMYSCAHIGLTLGLLPQRKLFKKVLERWRRGEPTDQVGIPRRHQVFLAVCLIGVLLAGFALTR